ncbi:energy-coupling factor transporter transmembrane protein EcfT [Eggerthella guodeyinii]|uniref:Energy-coupling factor transporter transmembrane protein EcfT n=1 Tax=Eggerthella guodeyinii TaxID=2690837 RepID=A0A6L7IUQ2_9ACTN|nr:energy-coupling factor transporter transmembrane component T [Eggerthella guodeyinii]QOS69256.1 energy-coupling factor transporter transmembrane protein EcfT [Eggerthella guodeyinii]
MFVQSGSRARRIGAEAFRADPRSFLACIVLSVAAVVFVRGEVGLACVFAAALTANAALGNGRYTLSLLAAYAVLLGVAWAGAQMLADNPANALGLSLGSMGSLGRRMLVPFSFAAGLAAQPTGSLLAALRALHLPKAAGIALAVLLRFLPTIGEEYRAIRRSQKFRGVGLGIANTLAHLPSTLECIVVPLVIRTTRISDELSASITVRGVRFGGETVSYRPVGFSARDAAVVVGFAAACAAAAALSASGVGA